MRKVNAYFSVEASIVVGWILFLMVFLLYSCFYLYDHCVLFQDAYAIAFRSSVKPLSNQEILSYAESSCSKQNAQKYLGKGQMSWKVFSQNKKVKIRATKNIIHPFGVVSPTLIHNQWTVDHEVTAVIQNPTAIIRKLRRVEHLAGMAGN